MAQFPEHHVTSADSGSVHNGHWGGAGRGFSLGVRAFLSGTFVSKLATYKLTIQSYLRLTLSKLRILPISCLICFQLSFCNFFHSFLHSLYIFFSIALT